MLNIGGKSPIHPKKHHPLRKAEKEVLLLMAGPLRPYHPPPIGLNGHRIFLIIKSRNWILTIFFLPPIFGLKCPYFDKLSKVK